jgi:hypothetical protein
MWTDKLNIIEMKAIPSINELVVDKWQGRDLRGVFKRLHQMCIDNLRNTLRTLLPERPKEAVRGINYYSIDSIMPGAWVIVDWAYFQTMDSGFVAYNTAIITTVQAMWMMSIIPDRTLRYGVPSLAWDWSKDIPWSDEKINGMPAVLKASEK